MPTWTFVWTAAADGTPDRVSDDPADLDRAITTPMIGRGHQLITRVGLTLSVIAALGGCALQDQTVTMTEYGYVPDRVEVDADGEIIRLVNDGDEPHDFSVEGVPAESPVHLVVFPDREAELPLPALPPGEYTIFCGVLGHREAGMEATLLVR